MVVILLIIGLAMITLGQNTRLMSIRTTAVMSARTAADAGISKAALLMKTEYVKNPALYLTTPGALITKVTTGSVTPSGTFNEASPAASYSYAVSYNAADQTYQVDSTGTVGDKQRTVHAILAGQNHFFGIGLQKNLFAKNNDTFVATANTNIPFTIKTNSTANGAIDLSKSTISGDVAVGDGGDPSKVITNPTSVTGRTYASPNYIYPPVSPPVGLPAGPNSVGVSNITVTKSCQFSKIDISGTMTINPNLGNIQISASDTVDLSELIIGTGTSVSLYIAKTFGGKNNVVITNSNNDATKLIIYGTGTDPINIAFKNNATIYAAIYAPNSAINFKNNGEIYGGIIADSFNFWNNCTFHYDAAFNDLNLVGVSNYYLEITRWWEE